MQDCWLKLYCCNKTHVRIETCDMWHPHFRYPNAPLRRLKKDIACFFFFLCKCIVSFLFLFLPLRVKLGRTEVPVQKRHAVFWSCTCPPHFSFRSVLESSALWYIHKHIYYIYIYNWTQHFVVAKRHVCVWSIVHIYFPFALFFFNSPHLYT